MKTSSAVREHYLTYMGRRFFVMIDRRASKVWELVSSERKLSAQLIRVHPPESDEVLRKVR